MEPIQLLRAKNRKLALKLYLAQLVGQRRSKKRFSIKNLTEVQCISLFRFSKDQIREMRSLLGIPFKVICKHNTVCLGTEALCILLRRLSYPNRLFDLTFLFRRNWSQIGEIFNYTLDLVYRKFEHLLTNMSQPWLSKEYLGRYSDAIARKGSPLRKCWGFIDGTVRPICRPRKYQKEVYNGHKRVHALKYQSIVAPNGLIVNMFGPIEGRRHDSFMLAESQLLPQLQLKNIGEVEPFCLYGDPAYPLRPELQAPFKGSRISAPEAAFNKKMSMCRITVEWAFGKILSLFAFVDYKKNQRLYLQPLAKYFKVATILTNIHTCYNGSQISEFFEFETLNVQDYLISGN